MKKKIKRIIKGITCLRRIAFFIFYSRQFRNLLEKNHIRNKSVPGEAEYKAKWKVFSRLVEPYSYRLFSNYCGYTPDIIPEDILHSYVEEVLNPIDYRYVYSDKNLFPLFCGAENLPRTVLFRIGGGKILTSAGDIATADPIEYTGTLNSLILKPSVDSCGGKGVVKFDRNGNQFIANDSHSELTKVFLENYGDNFILQEAIQQHPFMDRLNSTSVNTMRVAVYRSPLDEIPRVIGAVLRVGKNGAIVDNGHAGGVSVDIDLNSGKLGGNVIDECGVIAHSWNGVEYENAELIIPNWHNVQALCVAISRRIEHHRLIAFDVALNECAHPVIIEYNVTGFSSWFFMYHGHTVFGKYTDEVIDYCVKKLKR